MKKLSKIIFVLGLIIVLGSVFLKCITSYKESQKKNEFIQQLSDNDNAKEKIDLGDGIALIEIDSINLNTVIVNGTGKEEIRHFVGHFENTPMPGEKGNFAIAGHRSTVYNNIFNNLDKVKISDDIKITTLDGEFVYEVSDMFVTEPTNMSVLDQDMDMSEMTIVTCTDDGKDRVIVKAQLRTK